MITYINKAVFLDMFFFFCFLNGAVLDLKPKTCLKKLKLSALFNWTIKLLKSIIYALYFHYHNPRVNWIWFLLIWILIVPVRNIAFELIKSMRNLKLKQMLFSLFSKLINPLTLSTNFTCKFPLVKMINPYNHTVQPRGKQVYKAR